MRIAGVIVAAGLAGVAVAKIMPRTSNDVLNTLMALEPLDDPTDEPEFRQDWPGPWWPSERNPFHDGLEAEQVCWYFNKLEDIFDDMVKASYECDVSNTIYWANNKGPWKFVERAYHVTANAILTFITKLVLTDEFRQPEDQQLIIACHYKFAEILKKQLQVLFTRLVDNQATFEPYISRAMCYAQKDFALAYFALVEHLVEHINDLGLQQQFQDYTGAVLTGIGSSGFSVIDILIWSAIFWCSIPNAGDAVWLGPF